MFVFLLMIFQDTFIFVGRAQCKSRPWNFAVFKQCVENVRLYSFFEYQPMSLTQNSRFEKSRYYNICLYDIYINDIYIYI